MVSYIPQRGRTPMQEVLPLQAYKFRETVGVGLEMPVVPLDIVELRAVYVGLRAVFVD
ncbi:MAG: hypothetical protein WCQ69_11300 [Bacteroidales bacterium]